MNRDIIQINPAPSTIPLEGELKYTISSRKTWTAIALLDSRLHPDPRFPAGVVSSIYFDTREWAFLGEKRNSDFLKTKVRVRWYSPLNESETINQDLAFAEVKYKVGSRRKKIRRQVKMTGQQLSKMDLESDELMSVPYELRRAGITLRGSLVPAFVVQYVRRRFLDLTTGKRVCIDYDIGAPKVNHTMLSSPLPFVLGKTVIEVKSRDLEFPLFLRPLICIGLKRASFSKYYECYAALTKTFF